MIDAKIIMLLRDRTGAGLMDCKAALEESSGDMEKAIEYLRKKGQKKLEAKQSRVAGEGIIDAYIHAGGKVGVLVELRCETDFVARNDAFKELAHEIALQAAAMNPLYLSVEDVPSEILEKEKEIYREQLLKEEKPEIMIEKILLGKMEKYYESVCLLKQPFIKDDKKKIEDLISEAVIKLGENIRVERFIRFSL